MSYCGGRNANLHDIGSHTPYQQAAIEARSYLCSDERQVSRRRSLWD
jgi:hypothetical protein